MARDANLQNFVKNIEDCITELEQEGASIAPGEQFNQEFANVLL